MFDRERVGRAGRICTVNPDRVKALTGQKRREWRARRVVSRQYTAHRAERQADAPSERGR